MISPGDIWTLISWHLSFGAVNAIKQQDQTLWYYCAAPWRKETDQQLWPTATNFLTCRKTTLNHLEKTTTATKTTWVLPICDQHGVYEALSRRCRPGRKFLWAGQLFVCCLGHMQATSGSPVVRSQALQLSVCTTGLCVAPRTHLTEGRLENPPSTCSQHQRRRQYLGIPHALPPDWGLGPYNRALGWGRQVIKLSKSATNLTPWQYIELSESYVILTRKTKYVLRNLTSGSWSPFRTCIIVLCTPQGVSLSTVSLQFNSHCSYTWALISCPRPANLREHLPRWCNMTTSYADNAVCLYIQPKG